MKKLISAILLSSLFLSGCDNKKEELPPPPTIVKYEAVNFKLCNEIGEYIIKATTLEDAVNEILSVAQDRKAKNNACVNEIKAYNEKLNK